MKSYSATCFISCRTHPQLAEATNPMGPGSHLKDLRRRLGISTREVALCSKVIANAESNDEFLLSGSWLTEIENEEESLPSIYKLFTLACIYGLSFPQILELYGIDCSKLKKYHAEIPVTTTRVAGPNFSEPASSLDIPTRFEVGLNLSKTNLLSRMIESWGTVPFEFVRHFDVRHRCYGFVGLGDYTLYPLLRPGSLVEIDSDIRKPHQGTVRSEFHRPIYFVDLRNEYTCGWCELVEDKLVILGHPLSQVKARIFAHPREAEIIGQVTGVAMRLVLHRSEPRDEPPRSRRNIDAQSGNLVEGSK